MEDKLLLDYVLEYQGDYSLVLKAIKNNIPVKHHDYNGKYITINNCLYPDEFLDLANPPLVLFYKGNIDLLNTRKISIVGSRINSQYGIIVTNKICDLLYQDFTLVSGMAKGIDAIVHNNVLKKGQTIGVLGCGIDYVYPKENDYLFKEMAKNHLIISEYPGLVKPYKHNFPFRNRLIAALGESLIVTEANYHSGTFLTVNEAINLSKNVYVVPYPLTNEESGCNYLIQEGANTIYNYDVIKNLCKMIDK